jgi:hypothetical protein
VNSLFDDQDKQICQIINLLGRPAYQYTAFEPFFWEPTAAVFILGARVELHEGKACYVDVINTAKARQEVLDLEHSEPEIAVVA